MGLAGRERLRAGDAGAAAVELALILPFLLLLLGGIIDFGLAFSARISLTHAAREGARVYALTQDLNATQTRARAAAPALSGITATATTCTFGQATTVTLTAPHQFIFPFVGNFAGGTMQARGVMRCGG